MDTKNQKLENIFDQNNISFPKSLPNCNTSVIQLLEAEMTKSNHFEEKIPNKTFGFQHKAINFHTKASIKSPVDNIKENKTLSISYRNESMFLFLPYGSMGKKRKICKSLKVKDEKIILFHLSKTLHIPNNCVKFQNFLTKITKIIPHFVFKNVELSHFQAQERKL